MSNSITLQRIQYIKDAKVKDSFDNLVAAFKTIYGDKIPEDLQKAIDEKSKQFKN